MKPRDTVSAWWYVAGGFILGLAVGLLFSPEATRYRVLARRAWREQPSLASRVMRRLPLRVKLAGAYGAIAGAGRKAYQLAKENRHGAA